MGEGVFDCDIVSSPFVLQHKVLSNNGANGSPPREWFPVLAAELSTLT